MKKKDYIRFLKRAAKIEQDEDRSWTWLDVNIHPGSLTKMVGDGLIIVSKRSRRHRYRISEKGWKTLRGLNAWGGKVK